MTATETGAVAPGTAERPTPRYSREEPALDLRWWATATYLTAARIYLRDKQGRGTRAARTNVRRPRSAELPPAPAVAGDESGGLRRSPGRRLIERDRAVVGAPELHDRVDDPP